MKTSANQSIGEQGFTLIELLVVVGIIAIVFTTFTSLNFSFNNPSRTIEEEALRLKGLLEFSHEQAVLRGEEYGLRLNEAQYRFMRLDYLTDKWVDIDDDKVLRRRELPENMSFELALEDVDVILEEDDPDALEEPENPIKPQIFLLSSGELTPEFGIRLRIAGFDHEYRVSGTGNGQYELHDLSDEIFF